VIQTRPLIIPWRDEETHLELEISMPGVAAEDIDVTLSGRRLTVSYSTHREERSEQAGQVKTVKTEESLKKEVDLPCDVDGTSAEAVLRGGVLHLRLNKKPTDDPGQKVPVNVK